MSGDLASKNILHSQSQRRQEKGHLEAAHEGLSMVVVASTAPLGAYIPPLWLQMNAFITLGRSLVSSLSRGHLQQQYL